MNNIVPINQAKMPAAMAARIAAGQATNKNFSDGIRDSFPVLSIKGKVFRIRKDGQETPLVDPATRQVIPFLDVILVNASRGLAKSFYKSGFTDGDLNPPDCWSLDAVKPDPSVVNKVSPTCANCPMNVFGSAQSQDGNKRGGKACSDAKRIAVMMPGHLGTPEPLLFLLRIPATSLKNLKAYTDLLARQGWEPAACVTRLQFDYQQAYPKLEFHFVDSLDDGEYQEVVDHAESVFIASMLDAPEFDATASHPPVNPAVQPRVRQEAPVLDANQTVAPTQAEAAAPVPQRRAPAQAAPVETAAPVQQTQAAPVARAVDNVLIELPEGNYFNPATGEYVDAPPAQVEMPSIDPNTHALPDGKFFNTAIGKYVTNQNVGAPAVSDVAPPAKRTRAKKEPASSPVAAQPVAQQEAAAAPEANGRQQVSMDMAPANDQQAPDVGNGGVQPAPQDLEQMLAGLIPAKK